MGDTNGTQCVCHVVIGAVEDTVMGCGLPAAGKALLPESGQECGPGGGKGASEALRKEAAGGQTGKCKALGAWALGRAAEGECVPSAVVLHTVGSQRILPAPSDASRNNLVHCRFLCV